MKGTNIDVESSQLTYLHAILQALHNTADYIEKCAILDAQSIVKEYLASNGVMQTFIAQLDIGSEATYVIKAIIVIGQAPIIFNPKHLIGQFIKPLRLLIDELLDLELFYQHIGGIIGYHIAVLTKLVNHQKANPVHGEKKQYFHPEGLYLEENDINVRKAIRYGIENLEQIADLYPIGGSGDRLQLVDEHSGALLPVALLPFLGRTLLEGLIRDVQAREYLHYKLLHRQLTTPIACMTSIEKNNHLHILDVFCKANWFGRAKKNFYFFLQPRVPVITEEGNWSLSAPLTLTLKPSGHGVIWKLAEEQGIFNWLKELGYHHCFIRQINNPLAGIDHALFALMGVGLQEHKSFGFLSAERLLNSAEGMDILIETEKNGEYEYCLTNIEYTEFAQNNLTEIPASPHSPFSTYPANTNILFAYIPFIRNALKICPIPGQLINMKSLTPYINADGIQSYMHGGRLESTMQNIADCLTVRVPHRITPQECQKALQTFIIYQARIKTISTTKVNYEQDKSPLNTPEQAYYDLLSNHYTMFIACGFQLPVWYSLEKYLEIGPPCVIIFHPALGPLYSVIKQKIRRGRLGDRSEMQLEIAEFDAEDLEIEGSLCIKAVSPLGQYSASGLLQYGHESKCSLYRVKIENKGIDYQSIAKFWKNDMTRLESVDIILHESAEFHAEDIVLKGSYRFEVPAFHRMIVRYSVNGNIETECYHISQATWQWQYSFDAQHAVRLQLFKPNLHS